MDDEPLIRMMVEQMLEELGHHVVAEAGSISDALALAASAAFDLALLDINVGGTLSDPVAMIVDRRRLPFVFVSGYNPSGLPEQFRDRPMLQKPFSVPALKKVIELALGS